MRRSSAESYCWGPVCLTRLWGHVFWVGLGFVGRLGLTRIDCFSMVASWRASENCSMPRCSVHVQLIRGNSSNSPTDIGFRDFLTMHRGYHYTASCGLISLLPMQFCQPVRLSMSPPTCLETEVFHGQQASNDQAAKSKACFFSGAESPACQTIQREATARV